MPQSMLALIIYLVWFANAKPWVATWLCSRALSSQVNQNGNNTCEFWAITNGSLNLFVLKCISDLKKKMGHSLVLQI